LQAGHLLAAPVAENNQAPMLGIVLLSPYTNRAWNDEDQRYLTDAAHALAPILKQKQKSTNQPLELVGPSLPLLPMERGAIQAEGENSHWMARLEEAEQKLKEEKGRSESLAALVAEHPALQETIAQLEQRNQELEVQAAVKKSSGERPTQEGLISIAQELRKPLSAIVGYTDLLLGESVGLLGAIQRKFLERVKSSSARMGGLLEELIQVTAMDPGQKDMNRGMVDLNAVIDEAVSGMIAQVSQKNIALRVDLPDELPPIQADLEALQQVLANLLHNATLATPVDGEISLHVRLEDKENGARYLLLQVTDQGGGISAQDLPRVYSRKYRTDNVQIQGIGETGVGLSIVKALVEAQGGRIWVEPEMERGSVFSVLLPIALTVSALQAGGQSG
jgi:signal transduction histidine kinase